LNAEQLYREALRYKPTDSDALDNLGLLLIRNRRYYEASQTFDAALQTNPGDTLARNYLQQLQLLSTAPIEPKQ
jgi:Tfp pilus assembly protein PilF